MRGCNFLKLMSNKVPTIVTSLSLHFIFFGYVKNCIILLEKHKKF
jgi:hypothetical protein